MRVALRRQEKNHQPDDHRREPREADLPVAHLQRPLEDPAPREGADEREQAFSDEHQGDGAERDVPERDSGQAGYFLGAIAGAAPEPRIDLKKSLLGSTIIRSDLLRKLAR